MSRTMKTRAVHSVVTMSRDTVSKPKTAMEAILEDYAGRIIIDRTGLGKGPIHTIEVGIADSSGENGLWKRIF